MPIVKASFMNPEASRTARPTRSRGLPRSPTGTVTAALLVESRWTSRAAEIDYEAGSPSGLPGYQTRVEGNRKKQIERREGVATAQSR